MEEERAAGADKAGRRTHAARKPEMAGAWRRVRRAARQNREREGEADKRARRGIFLFFSFLFFWAVTLLWELQVLKMTATM